MPLNKQKKTTTNCFRREKIKGIKWREYKLTLVVYGTYDIPK